MKLLRYVAFFIFTTLFLSACGGSSGGPANIVGPELNLAEAVQLEVNQIFVKNWSGTAARPFFSVYIQDAISEELMACAGPDEGLDIASSAGIYYADLSVPFIRVTGATDKNTPIFNIIIVADQENPCPEPIATGDQVVGQVQVNFGELLDYPIEFGVGDAYVTLIAHGHSDVRVPDMPPAETDVLTVGELYFDDTPPGDVIPDYYLVLYVTNGNIYDFQAIIDPSEMPEMREPKIIYSWLNLAFSGTEGVSTDVDLLKRKGRIEFLKNDGQLIGKTSDEYIGDLIGRKIEFTNGKGYLKLRSVSN